MLNKVEICGIDTAKLPVLKEKEKNGIVTKNARRGFKCS